MRNLQNSSKFSNYTENMTPAEVAEQIYGIPYSKLLIEMMWSQNTDQWQSSWEKISESLKSQIQSYLLTNNHNLVEKVTKENAMNVSWWEFKWWDGKWIFQPGAPREVQKRDKNTRDFANSTPRELEITRDWTSEKIKIITKIVKDNDLAYLYTAIQIPKLYHKIPRKDLYVWKPFADHKDDRDFNVNLDRENPIDRDFMIIAQRSRRPNEIVWCGNWINARNNDAESTDAVRECLKQGMNPIDIDQLMLLWELIKDLLWEEYVNFIWHKADSDEPWFEDVRKKYQEIDNLLLTQFHYFDKDTKPKGWKQYVMRDYGVYLDKNLKPKGFLRGDFHSGNSAMGGVASVYLNWYLGRSYSCSGFRPCG